MKFYIQELDKNQYNDEQTIQIIQSLKGFSQQLASIQSIQRCIKYFYSKYETCIKYKLIVKSQQKRNVIYQILKNITLRKFQTLNMVYQIHKETLRKVKEEGVIYICQSIFQAIQSEHQKFLDDIIQLKRAVQMINDILNAYERNNNKDQDELQFFQNNDILVQYSIEYPDNQAIYLKNTDSLFQISLYNQNYSTQFTKWQKKNNNQSQDITDQINSKKQLIKQYIEKIELAQGYKTIQEEDNSFKQELYLEVNQLFDKLKEFKIQNQQEQENQDGNREFSFNQTKEFFNSLIGILKEIEHNVQIQFDNLKFINQQQGIFSTLINNSLLLKRASSYKNKIDQNEKIMKDLVGKYEEKLPEQVYQYHSLQTLFDQFKIDLNPNLKSEIFFILTQIWKKEDVTSDPSYYDQFKEAASDLINKNKWRIRQSCIYELLQFKNSCLTQATVDLAKGQLVRFQIYETDKRNKQLLDEQDQNQVVTMFQQCWASQEDDVQSKIKQKLEELNDIAYKITIETKQYEKSKYKKRYVELESEIQGIIKNAERLGNSLGTSLLFFQDIKNDLVNIQSQLKNLQGSIDQIHKDIQQLQGRSIKDLLVIRMQRVLQQRIIFNSENFYVPIKTKEKQVLENIEDEETPLYTDDLFGNGEINEFIWKQQKSSLLIHGQAGSGKSTAARKIEEFLWLLYKKNMNIAESIPIIPILIFLPQLTDPLSMAMEETLKSDNYRFNDKQILEFKEAVEQNQFKLIIIMDSYDEIKSEFTNRNLILSNKLYKWRCQSDEQKFPKIITTSRSEMFVNSDYRSWFLPERDNLQYYKEIRLLNFSREQVNIFIENYCILQVKKIIKDFFFNQKDNPGFFAFEELFIEVLKVINDNEQQDDKKDKKFLLSKSQINKISSLCDSFVTGDISFSMTQQLEEVWCQEYYQKNIKEMDLDSLLETPFMIEIVASVLPQMIKHRQELNTFKESFFKKLQQLNNMSREQIQKEWQRIVSNEKFLEEHLKVSNDSDREQIINKYFDKLENFKNLQSALRLDPLCSYDFYDQFFAQYFKRQINKLKDSGESLVYISNLADLWEFTHRLANDMTLSQLSQVKYIPRIQLFQKNKDSDWRDIYFNDEQEQGQIKKLFRKIMPLKQQYGIYSFNHKSLQEFLVAKWLIQSLELCNPDLYQKNQLTKKDINEIDAQLDDLCVHNLSKDFLNGVVKFMVDKLSSNSFLQQKLYDIVQFSKYIHEQIKEQDKVKISQNISIKRSQTQNLASQTISQNQYSDQEIAQRIMQASSNSLYLLHKLKCSLSSTNADLSNIQINDIELVKGNFFESQLNNSKFSKVNISQCNFNFANLNDVQWTDIQIDELPSIETKIQRNDLQHFHYVKSRDRLLCVSKYKDRWYDYKEQVEDKFTLKEFEQQNLKYILISQHDSQIALLCNDKIILISLTKTKIFKFPESFTVEAMCFTNKENEIIVVSDKFIKTIKTDFNEEEKIISNDAKDEISLQNTQIKNFTQIGILGEHIIIASEQKILICLEKKIYEFFYKCQHENCDSQLDNKNQKEKIPKCKHFLKYYCFEISLNQNYITLGYLQQTESHDNYVSILLIIDQQALIQTQVEENCMTVLQFTSLEIKNENQLKFKFVDDDKYLLSLSYKNNITYMRLWNYKEKKIVSCTMLDFQIKYITKITELLIATINQKGTIQIWDLQALLQQQNSNFNSTITSCIFSIKNHIISGNNDGIIQIWDRERGIQIGKNLQYHKSGVQSMTTYFKNTEILISGDFQGYINVCDLQTQQLLKSISTISPIKSLDFIQNSNHDIQLVTHSQFYHYLQLWSQDFESYSLFNQEEDNVIIQQSNLESTIQILHNKQTKCQPKSYSGLKNITDCSAFAIGKYTNNIYFAVYEFKNEDSNFKDVFIKVYREDFQDSKEQQKKDQAQELLVPLGIIYLAFAKEKNIEIVSIIKEVDQQNLLVSTEKTVFIIKLKKLSIEYKFRYPSFGKIRDLQIDEDLLFICGEIVSITNIRTGQLIPQTIQKPNENQQQSQIEGEQDLYCSLAYYRQKNTLFLGTTSGKIINYDLLYCNSQVYEQHSKEIIYLQIHSKQISTGRQDFLVTAAKDSFIKFWPLAIQDLKSIKPTETYQAILEDQIINKLWYFEKENFFICQNQKGCYVFAYFSNIQNPCYYFISESDPLMKCDYNNAKQILYQFTQNKNKNYSVQFTKTMVLQEALKAYYQEKNSYKIEIMLIDHNRQQIITSDEDGKIIFWDHNGKQLLDPIQAFEDDSSTQVCISLSKDLQTLICGCFQGGKQSQYFLTTISLKDKTKIQSQLDLGKLEQPKIKQLQQLSSKLFLILTDSLGDNINIYSLEKGIVIQKIKDRSGKSNGSSVLISEKGEAVFVTYGEFNQLTYYQSNKGIYAPRFIFGDAIKKFSCINTDTAQARITSKHDINLMKIFNPEKQENLKQK